MEAAPVTQPAEWVVAGLHGFASHCVLSIVPEGFDAYVRIFHPAHFLAGQSVTWREIAAANRKEAHAGMQLGALTGIASQFEPQPGVFDLAPDVGTLDRELAHALVPALARNTTTPDRCYFAVWHGFALLRKDVQNAPTFTAPAREYHLLTGPAEVAIENMTEEPRTQSANIWWPEDRAWCVATEIDLNSTYVGCSAACRDDLLELDLEAFAIDPETGITYDSDLRNGLAPRN